MKKFLSNNRFKFLIYFLLLILAITQCILFVGLSNLHINSFYWLFQADTAADLVNWLKFKNSDWVFPIGLFKNSELSQSSLAYTGSVPFLSIILKFFFKESENFQYFGLWILICFYLQLLFSYLIIVRKTKNVVFSILGSFFFALSPILFHRLGFHLSLSGHWILLAYFYSKILENNKNYQIQIIFIICFSSLIHFYFTLMLIWIELLDSSYNFLKKKDNFKNYLKYLLSIFVPLFFTMYLIGYFEIPFQDTLGGGYGLYKMNVLSIVNPLGTTLQEGTFNWSNFLPSLDQNYGEREGFSYLGLGALILFLISLYYFFSDKKFKVNISFLIIILSLTFFSLSNKIDFGLFNLIELNLNKKVEAILSLGRASGRFFWPVYYFILIFSLIVIYKKFLNKGIYLLSALLIIQIIDLSPGFSKYLNAAAFNKENRSLNDKIWKEIKSKNLILSSSFVQNGSADFYKTLDLNIKNLKSEITNLARYDRKKHISLRYKNYDNFYKSLINKEKVFLINNFGHLNHLKYLFKDNGNYLILKKDDIWMILDKELFGNEIKQSETVDKINSKSIMVNKIYKPRFNDGSFKKTFLGLGWANHRNNTVSDGKISSLLFDFSNLLSGKYELQINITPNILRENQQISIEVKDQKYIFNKDKDEDIFLEVDTYNIENLENFVIDFYNDGMLTEYDVLKSPDLKQIGFRLNFILLKKI